MYTINHKYQSDKLLQGWLLEHEFASKKECLVQFFSGIPKEEKIRHIATQLSSSLPYAHIIGTTTDGEISADYVTTHEIIISISIFEKSTISSVGISYDSNSFNMGCDIASKLDASDVKAMLLITTGLAINGEAFLKGVRSVSKGRYIISGGMASDNANYKQTYVSHKDNIISKGAIGVVLKGKELSVKNLYKFGWNAVGLPMRVTKSRRNRVYELDGMSVIDVYAKYFGQDIAEGLPKIGAEIPLIIERDGVKMARACIKRFDDGSLLFAGEVKDNEEVRFGIGSIDSVLRDSSYLYNSCKEFFIPESVFVYSCMARRRLLKDESYLELKKLASNCSVSGFFTNGEFFSDEKNNYLFNETITILALSELGTIKKPKKILNENSSAKETHDRRMMHALTHMTNVIAKEWQERVDAEIEKNKEQEKQSFQKNKLAQMGEMIGMIAHQWRQPLNAISATGINLSLLASMGKLEGDKVQESSAFIQEQCQKMSTTIDTFLNFVKPEKMTKAFKLSHTIDVIMEIMGTQLNNHNIQVNINSTDENISTVGHEDLLEQVIINLLSNARDAFDCLEIAEKFINITIDIKENIPLISIEDNAGGIQDNVKDKIFNPYFTTKEQGKGTGIGLYMSMDIMKKGFNGNLVYRATDDGSCFEIILSS